MLDAPSPVPGTLPQQLPFLGAPVAGVRAAIAPPAHAHDGGRPIVLIAAVPDQQEAEGVPAGNDERSAGRVVEAGLDTGEAVRFARPDATELGRREALRLLPHARIPDHQRRLRCR